MTRRAVYGVGLAVSLIALGMTIAAILIPEWINWEPHVPPPAKPVKYTYGLHSRCTTLTNSCTPFPQGDECRGEDRTFCTLWRTTGFLMSAAFILELAAVVAFAIPIFGGKQKREHGWRIVALVLGLCVACQVGGMGIIAGLHDRDERFFEGWLLGKSFALCVASWALQFLVAAGMVASALWLEEEGGYELIPDHATVR